MLIDLSVPLDDTTPVYPGDPSIHITQTADISQGYQLHSITMGTHIGTHIDAPSHMIIGGKSLGQYGIDTLTGPAVCVDASQGFDLTNVEAADINQGDIVLFYTGHSERYRDPDYFTKYPVISQAMADHLVGKGVKMVGFDTPSCDNADGFPLHRTLLGNEILVIENLVNVQKLAGKRCTIYALPLPFDLDGAPARVIARVEVDWKDNDA